MMFFLKIFQKVRIFKSRIERSEGIHISSKIFEYSENGSVKKSVVFLPGGKVQGFEIGSNGYWKIRVKNSETKLEVYLSNDKMLVFGKYPDGAWRGNLHSGEMEMELVPVNNINIVKNYSLIPIELLSDKTILPKIIHVLLVGQLGNCLRNIASIKILSDHIGSDWDIDLKQSFAPNEVNLVISKLFPERIKKYKPGSYVKIGENELIKFRGIYGTSSNPLIEGDFCFLPDCDFGLRHIYAVKPLTMTDEQYIRSKLLFFKKLIVWPDEILEAASVTNGCGSLLRDSVGLHIRYSDNFTDVMKNKYNLNTSLATFLMKISKIETSTFLLCTDNPDVHKIIKKHSDNLNIILPDTINNYLLQPLYEMYLLSKTKYIIGSYASTFSYESCFIEGTDLELYSEGEWINYTISAYR